MDTFVWGGGPCGIVYAVSLKLFSDSYLSVEDPARKRVCGRHARMGGAPEDVRKDGGSPDQ